jgi:Ras-related protein Rab-7A
MKRGQRCRYVSGSFVPQYKATIGADFVAKDLLIDDKLVTVQIWDTAGQEKFNSMQGVYYKGADGCVLVYDITDPESFNDLQKWREEFVGHSGMAKPEDFPFVLLGNKSDLVAQRKVAYPKAVQYSKEKAMIYYETSAKNGMNVKEAFEDIARKALTASTGKMYPLIPTFRQFESVGRFAKRTKLEAESPPAKEEKCEC